MNRVSQLLRGPFRALFLFEMRRGMGRLAAVAGLMVLADLYILVNNEGRELLFVPVFSLPVLAMLFGFDALRNEWREQTHYLLLSLPVPGRTLVGAKLTALGAQLAILSLVAAGLAWWHLGFRVGFPFTSPNWRLADVASQLPLWVQSLLAVSAFLPLMNLAAAGLLVFLAGQTVGRGRWLYVGVAVAALLWGVVHLAEPTWWLATQLPDVDLASYLAGTPTACRGNLKPVCTFDLGWPAMHLTILVVLMWAAVILWNRKAEV